MARNDKRYTSDDYSTPPHDVHNVVERAPGSAVTDEQLEADVTNPESWLGYNGGPRQLGYAPADRIRPSNVAELSIEYTRDLRGIQMNPIVVPSGDGEPPVMYLTRGQGVEAINARSGEPYWQFDYSPVYSGGSRNRNVGVRGDLVYLGAADLRLVALDRYTGEKQWTSIYASERQHEEMEPGIRRNNSTGGPLVYDGMVYKGQSGGGLGWGALVAMDAETGDVVWDFDVTPKDHFVGETWRFGDGAPWTTPAVDPQSDTLYLPTANPGPQLNAAVRPGPNKHTNSVVALDAKTGEVEWTHQILAGDWWDYDTYMLRIFDMVVADETRRVVQIEDKTGWIYVVDAETGRLVGRSEPHANQGAELPFMAVPPAGEPNAKEISPSAIGATDWHPDGYSPQTGLVYLGSIDDFKGTYYDPHWEHQPDTYDTDGIGGGKIYISDPKSGEKAARVTAIDPESGQIVWTTAYENDQEPFWPGGNTPTGGNLVFAGNNGGQFWALDAETGDVLWEQQFDQEFSASPVVWDDPEIETQFVAIASASELTVFGLEADRESATPSEPPGTPSARPTSADGTDETTSADGTTEERSDATDSSTPKTETPSAAGVGVLGGVSAGVLAIVKRVVGSDTTTDDTSMDRNGSGSTADTGPDRES